MEVPHLIPSPVKTTLEDLATAKKPLDCHKLLVSNRFNPVNIKLKNNHQNNFVFTLAVISALQIVMPNTLFIYQDVLNKNNVDIHGQQDAAEHLPMLLNMAKIEGNYQMSIRSTLKCLRCEKVNRFRSCIKYFFIDDCM